MRGKKALSVFGTVAGFSLVLVSFAGLAFATPPIGVPEIDPGMMGSAIALVAGGYLILKSRGRARK